MNRQDIVQLHDGAVLAFEEYGDPTGVPVIFCHGWPSSRTMAQLADEPARVLGVRIISPDRPGISGSSMQLDRKLSDWPSLVERLADDLELGEFRILAISGGAPYAYATAVAMPERVRAIAIVGGVIPFAELKDFKGLLPLYRYMLAFYRNRPRLLRRLFHLARPFLSFRHAAPASSVVSKDAAFATMRRGELARRRSVRSDFRKPTARLARLGGRRDGRRADLCAAVGVCDRRCTRAGATLAWNGRPRVRSSACARRCKLFT